MKGYPTHPCVVFWPAMDAFLVMPASMYGPGREQKLDRNDRTHDVVTGYRLTVFSVDYQAIAWGFFIIEPQMHSIDTISTITLHYHPLNTCL